jgi:hypothetical protein
MRYNDVNVIFFSHYIHLYSFITFPQIIFDGYQADVGGTNQSLPAFELVDILTADVSNNNPCTN